MKSVRESFVMVLSTPTEIDDQELGFDETDTKKSRKRDLLSNPTLNIVVNDPRYTLYICNLSSITLAFFAIDKKSKAITFYMEGDLNQIPAGHIGSNFSIEAIWKEKYVSYTDGMTRLITENYLIEKVSCLVSGKDQTPKGKKTWEKRFITAATSTKQFGVVQTSTGAVKEVYSKKKTIKMFMHQIYLVYYGPPETGKDDYRLFIKLRGRLK
jgi:hypothetical protein